MKITLEKQDDAWIYVHVKGKRETFNKVICNNITPYSYRKCNGNGVWSVHLKKVKILVDLARSCKYEVDWSALPKTWQMFAAGAALPREGTEVKLTRRAHAVLHVALDAPECVVKAAYEALVHLYHPDTSPDGGDAEKLKQVMDAYKKFYK